MPIRLRVQVEGLRPLQRRCRAEPLMAEPMRAAFEELGRLGVTETRRVAPQLTGRLRASVQHKVGGGAIAKNVRIKVTASRAGGYRYPGWLNYAGRSPRKGWFDKVGNRLKGLAGPTLARAARAIEARWR